MNRTRLSVNGKYPRLSDEQVAALRAISTPTIANAIETFGVRGRLEGVSGPEVRCLFPELGVAVGYACTATIFTAQPARDPRNVSRTEYWRYTESVPEPKITVVQDMSERPGGAYWGEVNSSIHKALGSQGVITNGTVRDLSEVRQIGFHFFASGVQVSHGFAHLEDFNRPVKVFGVTVEPGDLIHADQHGIVVIPPEVAAEVAEAAREIEERERPMIAACRMPNRIEALDMLIPPEY
jgi:regulator of RNase E activity RraA